MADDFDAGSLVGRTLEMLCFNSNQIYLHFGDKMSICAETPFLHETNSRDGKSHIISLPPKNSSLLDLISIAVVNATTINGQRVTLRFENGDVLILADTSAQYESFKFCFGERTFLL